MAKKKDINEVIDKAITEIMGIYLGEKGGVECVNENMLHLFWLMREQIHNKEKAFLRNLDSKNKVEKQ